MNIVAEEARKLIQKYKKEGQSEVNFLKNKFNEESQNHMLSFITSNKTYEELILKKNQEVIEVQTKLDFELQKNQTYEDLSKNNTELMEVKLIIEEKNQEYLSSIKNYTDMLHNMTQEVDDLRHNLEQETSLRIHNNNNYDIMLKEKDRQITKLQTEQENIKNDYSKFKSSHDNALMDKDNECEISINEELAKKKLKITDLENKIDQENEECTKRYDDALKDANTKFTDMQQKKNLEILKLKSHEAMLKKEQLTTNEFKDRFDKEWNNHFESNKTYENMITTRDKTIQELKNKVKLNEELLKKNKELIDENKKIKEEEQNHITKSQNLLVKKEQEITQLTNKLNYELQKHDESGKSYAEKIKKNNQEVVDLQNKLDVLRNTKTKYSEEVEKNKKLTDLSKKLEEEKQDHITKSQDYQNLLSIKEKEVEQLKQKEEQLKSKLNNEAKNHFECNKTCGDMVVDLQTKLELELQNIKTMNLEVKKSAELIEKLKQEKENHTTITKSYEDMLSKKELLLDELKRTIDQESQIHFKSNNTYENLLKRKNQEITELQNKLNREVDNHRESNKTSHKDLLDNKKSLRKKCENELELKDEIIEKLKNEMKTLKKDQSGLSQKNSVLKGKQSDLEFIIKKLEGEKEELEKTYHVERKNCESRCKAIVCNKIN